MFYRQNNPFQQLQIHKTVMTSPAVSQFANGSNLPSIEKLTAITDHFDISIDYLVGRSDDPNRK